MADKMSEPLRWPQQPASCPKCSDPLRLMHKFLDPRTGDTMRVYQCNKCGERTWEQ